MLRTEKNHSLILGLFVLLNLLVLIVLGPLFGIQSVGTYVLLPSLFVIALLRDRYTWDDGNKMIKIFFLYWIFSIVTVFYYVYLPLFLLYFSSLTGALLASYCVLALNKNENYEDYYHWGYIIGIVALIAIEYLNGNFYITAAGFKAREVMIDPRLGDPRLDRGIFMENANSYSYYSFFATVSLCYMFLKYRTKLYFLMLITLPVLFIMFTFVTQSRSGLLLVGFVLLVFWILVFRNKSNNVLVNMGRFLLIMGGIVATALKFMTMFENSDIKNRLSTTEDQSTKDRTHLIYEGFDMFNSSPVYGVGMGQFSYYSSSHHFSHNSYVEIIAEQGVIGAIFLFFLYGIPFAKSIKNLVRFPGNEMVRLNALFFTSYLLFNNVYVFYKFSFSMIFFFLFIAIQNKLTKKLEAEEEYYRYQLTAAEHES